MKLVATLRGREETVEVERVGHDAHHFRVQVGERSYQVDAADVAAGLRSLVIVPESTPEGAPEGGLQREVSVRRQGNGEYAVAYPGQSALAAAVPNGDRVFLLDPLKHLAEQAAGAAGGGGKQTVAAYMPGRVVTLLVEEGAEVEAGAGVVVLEAMKMENEITAERPGKIAKLLVEPGQAVETGDALFELE